MIRFAQRIALLLGFMALLVSGAGLATAQEATPSAGDLIPYAPAEAGRLIALSPDGTMVAGLQQETGALCTFAVPSGETIACADLDEQRIALREDDVRWSPDSQSIVFAEKAFIYLVDGDLWRFNAKTGELTDLTDEGDVGEFSPFDSSKQTGDVYFDVAPAWSPDGGTIAFSRTTFAVDSDDTPNDLMLLDVASGEVTRLLRFDPTYPGALYFGMGWSPDGGTIYGSASYADLDNPRNGVWAFDVATGEGSLLAGASEAVEGAYPALLAVSPAGDSLTLDYPAFLGSYGYSGQQDVSGFGVLSLENKTVTSVQRPTDLIEYGYLTAGPNFTPDGSMIVYGAFDNEARIGYVIMRALASGEETVLAELPDEWAMPLAAGIPLQLGADGTILIQTQLTQGYLSTLPADVLTPPQPPKPSRPPFAPAATPVSGNEGNLVVATVDTVVRSAPSVDAQVVLVLQPGAVVEPIGEPVEAEGEQWTPVRDPESATIGYIRASDLEPAPDA